MRKDPAQIAFARTVAGSGADWIILLPTPVRSNTEIKLIRIFHRLLMQSLDNLLCCGNRLAAQRYGIETVYYSGSSLAPKEFGLSCLGRLRPRQDRPADQPPELSLSPRPYPHANP